MWCVDCLHDLLYCRLLVTNLLKFTKCQAAELYVPVGQTLPVSSKENCIVRSWGGFSVHTQAIFEVVWVWPNTCRLIPGRKRAVNQLSRWSHQSDMVKCKDVKAFLSCHSSLNLVAVFSFFYSLLCLNWIAYMASASSLVKTTSPLLRVEAIF